MVPVNPAIDFLNGNVWIQSIKNISNTVRSHLTKTGYNLDGSLKDRVCHRIPMSMAL